MGTYHQCQKCKNWTFATGCMCKSFTVIDEDGQELEFHAHDEQDAALAYAEETNVSCDYYLMNSEETVTVNGKKFVISAEPSVSYHANEV